MSRKEIFEKTIDIIKMVMFEDQDEADTKQEVVIEEETNLFRELGLDSIQLMTVISELEDEFDMEFLDEDMDMDFMIVVKHLVDATIRGIDARE